MFLRHLKYIMKAKNLDVGYCMWTKHPNSLSSYLSLEVVTRKERTQGIPGTGEVRSPSTTLQLCHVPEVLSWLVRLRDSPGPSCCQDTVPLPRGADRAGLSFKSKPLELNNSVPISILYIYAVLANYLNFRSLSFYICIMQIITAAP